MYVRFVNIAGFADYLKSGAKHMWLEQLSVREKKRILRADVGEHTIMIRERSQRDRPSSR